MTVIVTKRPCMLLEATELVYIWLNEVPLWQFTSEDVFSIPVPEAQRMLDAVASVLQKEEEQLRFYFQKEPLLDGSGSFTCLARCMVRNTLNFSCATPADSVAELKASWADLRRQGCQITSINADSLNYEEENHGRFIPLADQIDCLAVSTAFRKKLLEAFSGYGDYLDQLARLLQPVVDLLEPMLMPWTERAEPLLEQWRAYFSAPEAAEKLMEDVRYGGVELKEIYICLRYLDDQKVIGRLDTDCSTIWFHAGVGRTPARQEHKEMEEWEYYALRLLGSQGRMKMLRAMSKRPMTIREMAQQLEMHLGTVSRDIRSMYEARLIITDTVNGRSFYRTNMEVLNFLVKRLQTIPESEDA